MVLFSRAGYRSPCYRDNNLTGNNCVENYIVCRGISLSSSRGKRASRTQNRR